MVVRDKYGIIVQQPDMDGGDSASRTGIMALCGSQQDYDLLPLFVSVSGLVRHPYQAQWADAKLTSRDQLVCFSAVGGSAALYAKSYFINKDFLAPDVRLYLHRCAGIVPSPFLELGGRAMLFISILYNAFVTPNSEQNQLACICIIMGPFWIGILNKLHPELEHNITNYWSGWRDQAEIGETFNRYIKEKVNVKL